MFIKLSPNYYKKLICTTQIDGMDKSLFFSDWLRSFRSSILIFSTVEPKWGLLLDWEERLDQCSGLSDWDVTISRGEVHQESNLKKEVEYQSLSRSFDLCKDLLSCISCKCPTKLCFDQWCLYRKIDLCKDLWSCILCRCPTKSCFDRWCLYRMIGLCKDLLSCIFWKYHLKLYSVMEEAG